MSKIIDILNHPKVIGTYVQGVVDAMRRENKSYDLTFVKDCGIPGWRIDIPGWQGSLSQLAMVAGADTLLDYLHACPKVNINVIRSNERIDELDADGSPYFRCERTVHSMSGSTYKVANLNGWQHDFWICPVTLFVMGEYPKYIYIRPLEGCKTEFIKE